MPPTGGLPGNKSKIAVRSFSFGQGNVMLFQSKSIYLTRPSEFHL